MHQFVHLIITESGMQPDQVEVNIPTLLRSCLIKLLFNLILSLGSDDSLLQRRARSALMTVRTIVSAPRPGAGHDVSAIAQAAITDRERFGTADSPPHDSRGKSVQKAVDVQLADFLSKHVLRVLAYMNEVLQGMDSATATGQSVAGSQDCSEQFLRQAIRAIGELALMLDSKTVHFVYNIVATLSPLLESPLASITLESWSQLAESLGSVILTASQLNLLIVPLLRTFLVSDGDVRSGTAQAVNRVVLIHEVAIERCYPCVCPIPDYPLLSQSIVVLREIDAQSSIQQRLGELTQLLKTKDATIVFCTAREMCMLVKRHEQQINEWKFALSRGGSGEPDVWDDA
ncbi:hypothetical protein FBU59_007038, partial [Linderina macrospora]